MQSGQQQTDGTYYDPEAASGFVVEAGTEGGRGGRWLVPAAKKRRGEKRAGGGSGVAGRLSEPMILDEEGIGEGGGHGGEEERAYQLDQRELGELDRELSAAARILPVASR
jgi:hypothetical protein